MKLSWHSYQISMSLELNVYETIEWNFPLRMGVSYKFYFILHDVAVLETMK